jgi:hypothetical protein
MAKRSGIPPKSVESRVSMKVEAQDKLWGAVPRLKGENLKAWFPRVASEFNRIARQAGYKDLSWGPRRVRAYWNGEARRIDHLEIRVLELREKLNELEHDADKHRGEMNDIAIGIATARAATARAEARGTDRQGRTPLSTRGRKAARGGRTEATGPGYAGASNGTAAAGANEAIVPPAKGRG